MGSLSSPGFPPLIRRGENGESSFPRFMSGRENGESRFPDRRRGRSNRRGRCRDCIRGGGDRLGAGKDGLPYGEDCLDRAEAGPPGSGGLHRFRVQPYPECSRDLQYEDLACRRGEMSHSVHEGKDGGPVDLNVRAKRFEFGHVLGAAGGFYRLSDQARTWCCRWRTAGARLAERPNAPPPCPLHRGERCRCRPSLCPCRSATPGGSAEPRSLPRQGPA